MNIRFFVILLACFLLPFATGCATPYGYNRVVVVGKVPPHPGYGQHARPNHRDPHNCNRGHRGCDRNRPHDGYGRRGYDNRDGYGRRDGYRDHDRGYGRGNRRCRDGRRHGRNCGRTYRIPRTRTEVNVNLGGSVSKRDRDWGLRCALTGVTCVLP